ncbi:polysaccharide lyase family 7 protein [Hymenobacter artigasi]|uniref:Alginate lyase 2 domain-containing protein n=1 Tax=Hymenobacter artigasi TaxID=2719616 RepID=A0ABX1HM75_9BACT|nr:polysaccharide lyase family 7 protein [Hymenobacter artigasi]NKI90989.1 hypothetical protein [Hymenobacter artigasi]
MRFAFVPHYRQVAGWLLLPALLACSTAASVPPATPATPPAAALLYPAQVLNLEAWKVTLPENTAHAGDPVDEVFRPELDTYAHPTFFHLNDAKDAVVFRAYVDAPTTKGSGYPRCELREMTAPATSDKLKAVWGSATGTHTMLIDQAVTHLPDVKKHVVVGQIHDADDDVIVFRLEDRKLFVDLNGTQGPILTSSYVLGTRFTVQFSVANNKTDCYYNGTKVYTYNKAFAGAYFKAGVYVQSSCQNSKKVAGEPCTSYGEVQIYNLQVTHQ